MFFFDLAVYNRNLFQSHIKDNLSMQNDSIKLDPDMTLSLVPLVGLRLGMKGMACVRHLYFAPDGLMLRFVIMIASCTFKSQLTCQMKTYPIGEAKNPRPE